MAEPHPQSWGPSLSAVGHRNLHYQQVSSRCCCCWSSSKLENPWVQEQNGGWYWKRKRVIWKKLEGWGWNFYPGKAHMQRGATDTKIKRVDVRLQGSFWMLKEMCREEVQSQMGGQTRVLEGSSGWAEMTWQADEDLKDSSCGWRVSPDASANKILWPSSHQLLQPLWLTVYPEGIQDRRKKEGGCWP